MLAREGGPLNLHAPNGTPRPRTLLAMNAGVRDALRAEGVLDKLAAVADVDTGLLLTTFGPELGAAEAEALATTEVLLTHWACPALTEEAVARMPRLRAVVHAAGSVKQLATEAVWRRGIAVSSAAAANAVPVAEFTVAAILLAGKRVLPSARAFREQRDAFQALPFFTGAGNYRRTVGIVGASTIGRLVIGLLRPFDLEVLVYDPYLDEEDAAGLGVERVELDELARRSTVVSIHAPQLPETRHMFDARRLALLPDGATLVNTARGSLVDTDALVAELATGRIEAVIDVTDPDPLPTDSPLFDLPNVLLTPHVAGSLGNELGRMADAAIAEIDRFARGLPLAHPVSERDLHRSA
ncbi:hydroxyacid dehydrogenase [Streptomyces sp. NPDC051940]|uniref:hydroxyacid dehydrogenase n=1 Tax=Streptomyces sp. NPDC051940 TaxID=3155675 RepID=UPI00341ED14A